MATVAASGNDGRVKKTGGINVALLNKWTLSKQTAKIVIPHFESDTDADGNVWPSLLRGLSSASGSAGGFLNVDPTDATDSGTPGLSNGLFVNLDLILIKGTAWGIKNLPIFIDQIDLGTDVNNQAASFQMNFTVNGVAGKTSL
jgi:hypothetical protein